MFELNAATIAGGGLVESLNAEIQKAVANCLDINTEAKKTRTVTLKVKIKPDDSRCFASVSVETSSTLCPPEPVMTSIYMESNIKTGEISATEMTPGETSFQGQLPGTTDIQTGKVTRFAN